MSAEKKELLAQKKVELKRVQDEVAALLDDLKADAIQDVRNLVSTYGLKSDDVFKTTRSQSSAAGTKVAPKYRNPETGDTWSGRGKAPLWIQGKDRAAFAV